MNIADRFRTWRPSRLSAINSFSYLGAVRGLARGNLFPTRIFPRQGAKNAKVGVLFLLAFTAYGLRPTAHGVAATPCIKHTFVSAEPDSPDATKISSSEWNDCHTVEDGGIDAKGLAITIKAEVGTTYTYLDADRGKLVTHSNASPIAATLPNAAGAGFDAGWFVEVQNIGAGTLTITPTTSTIDGAASLALSTNQGVRIVSNGTNYFTERGMGGGDVSGPASSTDGKSALFNGATGKSLKESTLSGVIKETAGLPAAADANDLSAPVCAIDSVGTDSYAITLSPAIGAYQTNALYCFKAGTANTGAASLAINGLAPITIKLVRNSLTTDLATGDILANQWVVVRYDNTNMIMQTPSANPQRAFNASSAATGIWVCDDLVPTNCGYIYWSAANGLQVVCAPGLVENDCNYVRKLAAGKIGGFSDRNGANIFTITEDNGKGIVKITLGSDATGDMFYRDSNGNFVRLGIGASTTVLHGGTVPAFNAIALADLPSTVKTRGISFTIGSEGGSALTAAATTTAYVTVPFACTLSAYNLIIDAGTITVKFWKVATGTAKPASGNSINTSGVGISSGTAIHSTTMTDFTTTTVSANDMMAMNVTAVATAKTVNGVLQCDQ